MTITQKFQEIAKRSKIIQFSLFLACLTRVSRGILFKVKFKGQTINDGKTMTLNEYSDVEVDI